MTDPIEEARALLAKATLGEWSAEPHGIRPRPPWALYAGRDDSHHGLRLLNMDDGDSNFAANVALIVAAPRLLWTLADECDRLRTALAEAEAKLAAVTAERDASQAEFYERMADVSERLAAVTAERDAAFADGIPAKTWRAMWDGLRAKIDEMRRIQPDVGATKRELIERTQAAESALAEARTLAATILDREGRVWGRFNVDPTEANVMAAIDELFAELAAVTAEREDEKAAHAETYGTMRRIADQRDEALSRAEAAESALARAMDAMPSGGVYTHVKAALRGYGGPVQHDTVLWLARLDAFRASQAQQTPAADVVPPISGVGGTCGVPPSRGDIGGPSGERVCTWRRFVPTSHPTKGKFITCAGWLVRKDPAAVWCMYCGGKIVEVDERASQAETKGGEDD